MGETEGAAESKLTQLEGIASQLAHLKSALETFSGSLEGDEDYASSIDEMGDHLGEAEEAVNEALTSLRAAGESTGEASETGSSEETA